MWAMLLARHDDLRPDPELLYVASMLHDLMLTDKYRDSNSMSCFGARGGIFANEWARQRGWPAHRCETQADAISLHLNVRVDARYGPEAQLLQAGAGVDVIGLRLWEINPRNVEDVLSRYPLNDFLDGLAEFEAEAHPHTRTKFLIRWLMFMTMARRSPLVGRRTGGY